jgi:autotransporter-associated beta strand protein
LLDSFDLSPDRAITLQLHGGTIDSNGFVTTVSQPITGLGNLTVQSSVGEGAVILNGVSTYFGLTTVQRGTLAIGDSDHQSAALAGRGPVIVDGAGTFGGYGSVAGSVLNLGSQPAPAARHYG